MPEAGEAPSVRPPTAAVVTAIAALVGGTAVVMLLTTGQMWEFGEVFPPLGWTLEWLKTRDTPFDLVHLVFFAGLAMVGRLLLPRVRARWLLMAFGLLAVGTELSQFESLDRTPSLLDARDDMIGAVLGLALAAVPVRLASRAQGLLLSVRGLILLGVLVLPSVSVWAWLPTYQTIHASELLFLSAIGLRAVAWAGGQAPWRWTRLNAWLAAWMLGLVSTWLAQWPSQAPLADAVSCLVPPLGWVDASWRLCMGAYFVLLASLVAEQSMNRRFARLLLPAAVLALAVGYALHGGNGSTFADWGSSFAASRSMDTTSLAENASTLVATGLWLWLLACGAVALGRGNLSAGGGIAALAMASVLSGSVRALEMSSTFWMIVGLLAGTVAQAGPLRSAASSDGHRHGGSE